MKQRHSSINKIITLIGLILLFSSSLHAQKKFFFYDEFDDNRHDWPEKKSNTLNQEIKDGMYHIVNKTQSSWLTSHPIYLNKQYDFRMEIIIYFNKDENNPAANRNTHFGLSWGVKDWGNRYVFNVGSNKEVSVSKYKYNKQFFWAKSQKAKVSNIGEMNRISIEKKGDQMTFAVNGSVVCEHKFDEFFDQYIAFEIGPKADISIGKFVVDHDKPKINLVKEFTYLEKKKNLGSAINTKFAEIAPIISPDGKTLYFARFRKEYRICDIWYSEKSENGKWSKSKKMEAPLNNEGDNVVIAVSADGNTLLLEGRYRRDGTHLSDDDMSITHRTKDGWTVPEVVKIKDYYNKDEHFSFSPTTDRKVLVMSVNRDDSYGNKDLYVSFLQPDGTYSIPKNMGPTLNTNLAEGTPFIAADGKTMYFSSQGLTGYGNNDIFMTKRLDDTWTNWSEPKNMGPEINTDKWDVYYSLAARGDYAYVVSVPKNQEREDIFVIKLSEEARPDPVVLVKGKVLDKESNAPLEAKIIYRDQETGKKVGEARSNPRDGDYSIVLPYGKIYSIAAKAKDHLAIEDERIDLSEEEEYREIEKNLFMAPVLLGQTFELHSVQFFQNKAELKPSSFEALDELVDMLKAKPTIRIELGGHTETYGNEEYLLKLSQDRVEMVKKYLVEKGIDEKRIKGKGYGKSKPLGVGKEFEHRNRRVEMKIIGM